MSNFARISFFLLKALGRLEWDEKRLKEYQDKRVREVVNYAYTYVPFYHRLFKTAGIEPSGITGVDGLGKLPIIRKSDLKKLSYSDIISREFLGKSLKSLKTGGSTGEPFTIYVNGKEDDWRKAIYLRANVSCGQGPYDSWAAVLDAERSEDVGFVQHAIRVFAKTIVPVVWSRSDQLKAVEKFKPDILDGFSNALWLLAKEAESKDSKSIHPKMIFGTGELSTTSSRKYLEKVFNAPFYDQFGCTEIDRSAWQCPEKIGYHIDLDSTVMQFVDDRGEVVGSGERGEIVYTSLFNHAMPFIRYGTRDIGIPLDGGCTCGRSLPLMSVVEGRANSFLVFPGGKIVSPMSFIETLKAFQLVREIDQYRVIQKKENMVEILIKKTEAPIDEKRIRAWLLNNIYQDLPKVQKLDLSAVTFEVKFVEDLPSTQSGKLNVVSSSVNNFD